MMRFALGCRLAAIGIAVLALLDPVITVQRPVPPTVSVVALDAADRGLAHMVGRTLSRAANVIDAPFAPAVATILVGSSLPQHPGIFGGVVFVVAPTPRTPAVNISSLQAPSRVSISSRVDVRVVAHARNAAGRSISFTLGSDAGLLDRVDVPVSGNDELLRVPLSFVPHSVGTALLTITASDGKTGVASASHLVDVRSERWSVLFLDSRPSWMSTFVRRTIESDPRFVVTSRVVTTRGSSVDAGAPPASVSDGDLLGQHDVVVLGAPEALSEADVNGLERLLRGRGGAAVLLMDAPARGSYTRLTRTQNWLALAGRDVHKLTQREGAAIQAAELWWPAALPVGATGIALRAPIGDSARQPIVWRTPVGAGELIVSGALDSWRYRDSIDSGFESFWRDIVANAAAGAVPGLETQLSTNLVRPLEDVEASITVRNIALASTGAAARARIHAALRSSNGASHAVSLRSDGASGRVNARFIAPADEGEYRIVVQADSVWSESPILVSRSATLAAPDVGAALNAFSHARGGRLLYESQLDELPAAVFDAVRPALAPTPWHPMRSPWWIVPFTALLGAAWLPRRTR
jgi:hypothetical protein